MTTEALTDELKGPEVQEPVLALPRGVIQGMNHKDLYKMLLGLSSYEVEMLRETAAQIHGYVPSAMWHSISARNTKSVAGFFYDDILKSHTGATMAKMTEADGKHHRTNPKIRDGGYTHAMRHTLEVLIQHLAQAKAQIPKSHRNIATLFTPVFDWLQERVESQQRANVGQSEAINIPEEQPAQES